GADAKSARRLMTHRGYTVYLFINGGKVGEGSSMAVQLKVISSYGLSCRVYEPGCGMLEEAEPVVLVDGLFGTGLARKIEGDLAEAVSEINRLREERGVFVTSVDIPSGISSDDGSVMGCAVKSDLTVTFAFYKRGQFLYPGAAFCGDIALKEIGITERSLEKKPDMFIYDHERIRDLIPDRDPAGNKGTFGKVLVAAGSAGMCGAAYLCASAAFAAGAGMVKIFTPEENRPILQTLLPEAMITACDAADPESLRDKLRKDLEWADILILGPGIGRGDYAKNLLHDIYTIMKEEKALVRGLVLDADGLWVTFSDPELTQMLCGRTWPEKLIMTPHLGEFAHMAGTDIRSAAADRIFLSRSLAQRCRGVILCKDARTIAAGPEDDRVFLNQYGTSGMAAAGSGDVLTGICGGFLAAGMEAFDAACTGCSAHARAGEAAALELGDYSMKAGDIISHLPGLLK
ncbi:MAG: NAD(P)H-hydrate dehydratase, partial [Lachnospiraceae bacterium]|nr:NAD(P)H-hydrate dehydratase [Lachnospiraceae bacterium]